MKTCWSVIIALVTLGMGASAQLPQSDRPVVINFAVPVDNNSTNNLLRIISAQIQQGSKKVTVLISSPGGDTISAFATYNILKSLPIELTTVNIGTVDSAALLIFCAGIHRESLAGPGIRFLIHGNSGTYGIPMDANAMDAQLQQLKNMNQMVIQVLSLVAPEHRSDIEKAVASQRILGAEEAKSWHLVQDLTDQLLPAGANFIAVNSDHSNSNQPIEPKYGIVSPAISADRQSQGTFLPTK